MLAVFLQVLIKIFHIFKSRTASEFFDGSKVQNGAGLHIGILLQEEWWYRNIETILIQPFCYNHSSVKVEVAYPGKFDYSICCGDMVQRQKSKLNLNNFHSSFNPTYCAATCSTVRCMVYWSSFFLLYKESMGPRWANFVLFCS